jgi:hypothetical protein
MGSINGKSNNSKGRPAGIKDKRLLYKSVQEQLSEAGFNPVELLIKIARNDCDVEVDIKTRKSATKDLLDKAYPDLRAIDIKSDQAVENVREIKDYMSALLKDNKKDY